MGNRPISYQDVALQIFYASIFYPFANFRQLTNVGWMFALYCVTAAFVTRFRTGRAGANWVYRSFLPYLIYLIAVDDYFYIKLL